MSKLPRIVVLLPGLAAHGGIQRHNRTFCKVLTEYAAQRSACLEVISLSDPQGWHDERYLARPLSGCAGGRGLFVSRTLAALAKPYDLLIVGHVDFSPLVLPTHLVRPHSPIFTITHGIEVWSRLPRHKLAGLIASDRILSVSRYTADKLVSEQGVNPKIIQVIPNLLDPDFQAEMAAWQATGQSVTPTRLLTISRMHAHDADKGIDHVIRALPAIRARIPDVNYVVVGDGSDRPRLEQLAHEKGVSDIVTFAGRMPDQQLHSYLAGTDLFVLPSRKEGFGIVFLEAMAYAKPVIAGAHGGSPEVVVDGETGVLVKHGDVEALVGAISGLLQDAGKRRAMGAAGLERVHTVYNYDRFRLAVEQTLDELIGNAGQSSRKQAGNAKLLG